MDRVPTTTTCRCGYASPATLVRCLGCGRRFSRCAHVRVAPPPAPVPRPRPQPRPRPRPRQAAPVPRPVVVEPSAFAGRDAERFGAPPTPEPGLVLPTGPLAVLGLVAAAWIGPEGPRPELLTTAALLGAGLSLARPAAAVPPSPAAAPPSLVLPSRLTDDELRDAIAAW